MTHARSMNSTPGNLRPLPKKSPYSASATRRSFLHTLGLVTAGVGLSPSGEAEEKSIQGFEKQAIDPNASKDWQPISDRKLRMGIVGYGYCKFGAEFGFQDHPNVEIV